MGDSTLVARADDAVARSKLQRSPNHSLAISRVGRARRGRAWDPATVANQVILAHRHVAVARFVEFVEGKDGKDGTEGKGGKF